MARHALQKRKNGPVTKNVENHCYLVCTSQLTRRLPNTKSIQGLRKTGTSRDHCLSFDSNTVPDVEYYQRSSFPFIRIKRLEYNSSSNIGFYLIVQDCWVPLWPPHGIFFSIGRCIQFRRRQYTSVFPCTTKKHIENKSTH